MQNLSGKAFFFAQQSQKQVLGPNVLMRKTLGFFGGIRQHALAFVAQRKIDGSRDLLADRGVTFDLLPDRFDRGVGAQKAVGQGLIFAQQPEQQMFGLNIRRAKLAGLVPRKEDDAPGFLRVAFKHKPISPRVSRGTPRLPPNP